MIKNKKGFTLIELIIVMAIVGILAVVAVVAISSKAGDARDARRRSDLSAVQTAFALYTSDGSGSSYVDSAAAAAIVFSGADTDPGTYMDLSNVNDPTSARAAVICASVPAAATTCNQAGNYSLLDMDVDGDGTEIATFSDYKVGAVLDDGSSYIYVTQLGISS